MKKPKHIKFTRASDVDEYTGLPMKSTLESQVASCFNDRVLEIEFPKTDEPLSVILFDVDYFKALNDLIRYEQGNVVLRDIGKILREYGEQKDFLGLLARWGGEEFLMLLPYAPQEHAHYIADEIREKIYQFAFEDVRGPNKNLKEHISVSLGVKTVDIVDILNAALTERGKNPISGDCREIDLPEEEILELFEKQLVVDANTALEYAKFMGRNRVEVFSQYLQSEVDNLNKIRKLYFTYSFEKPSKIKSLFPANARQQHKEVLERIEHHFSIIRAYVNPRDTRTQAVFADNLYELVLSKGDEFKKKFLSVIDKTIS